MGFTFTLHPAAAKAFEARANELVAALRLEATPPPQGPTVLTGSAKHVPVAAHLGPSDFIGHPQQTLVDTLTGQLVGVTLLGARGVVTLDAEASEQLSRLAADMAARGELRTVCDAEYIQKALIAWMESSNGQASTQSFLEQLARNLDAEVQETKFRVPLIGVVIERPFELGPYAVGFFSGEDIDRLVARLPEEARVAARQKYERNFQGKVCVEGSATCVPTMAAPAAISAAQDAVAGLRFVSFAAVNINFHSCIHVHDHARAAISHVVLETPSGTRIQSGEEDQGAEPALQMRSQHLSHYGAAGLAAVDAYLKTAAPSELQEDAWGALKIFTRGIASTQRVDRLIGALVAAETLLLGGNDPVQQSLSQRMAMLLGGTLAAKKQLRKDIAAAYAARSAFVHHGKERNTDQELLSRVLGACREVVHACLRNSTESTSEELIRRLEDQLLGGPCSERS